MKCCLNLIASLYIFKYLYILIGKASLLGFIVVFRKKNHIFIPDQFLKMELKRRCGVGWGVLILFLISEQYRCL